MDMKIKIIDAKKSNYPYKDGTPKYQIEDGNGAKHSSPNEQFLNKIGEIVDVEETHGIFNGTPWSKITLVEPKAEEKVETENKVSQEVWERKDRWQAKESAWKSAGSVFQGTGEALKTAKLAQDIYESITGEEWKIQLINGFAKKEEKPKKEEPKEDEVDLDDISF